MLLGNLLGSARKKYRKISVEGICFDSRKVKKKDIFFAIKGNQTSGTKFIEDAISKGASVIVSDEKIKYTNEVLKGQYALVTTEVVRPTNIISVDYKLINENGTWKVYDFVIEGVSMIRNYRSQFTKIIRKESYEVLVQKLVDKINKLEQEGPQASEKL